MENKGSSSSVSRQSSHNLNSSPSITSYLHRHGYRLGKIIGEGSYSKVRLTTRYFSDGTPAYRLASKVISKKKASEDFVTKFLPRELQIVSRLQHPNIVRVYDVVEFDDHVYIFMDWCDKGDLLEYVKSKGSIPESKGHHYFRQLISAVRYLHNLDLSHRDLKCENILMASQDQIRISDFGFARSCRDLSGKRILSNTYCGSAAYAAPEILQGTSYNPKLYDMWSLGCVLFIMLTGHMPYDESNIQRMLKHQLERTLTYPAQVYQSISDKAKLCIRRLLEPDVTRRANIEQTVADEWVLQPCDGVSRPQSAAASTTADVAGDGDTNGVRNSEVVIPKAVLTTPRSHTHGDHQPQPQPPVSGCNKKLPKILEPDKIRVRPPTPSPTPTPGTGSMTSRSGGLGLEQNMRNVTEQRKLHARPSNLQKPGPSNNIGGGNMSNYRPASASRGNMPSGGGYGTRYG